MTRTAASVAVLSFALGCGVDANPRGSQGGPGADVQTIEDGALECAPAWETPWVGSPCADDTECGFDGGRCLPAEDGFVCGTCTMDCAMLCPDAGDAPVTFCINGTDVGQQDEGMCLSKCDTDGLGGDGCREGYACDILGRFDASASAGVCVPEEFDDGDADGPVSKIDHAFLIDHLGGEAVDPFDFGPDLDSFQMYLDAVGVQHTSATEIASPFNPGAAAGCGLDILLPGRELWPNIGALALLTDELRELVGEPIFMRNWWRPPCYNSAVGGAATGDHPDADAVDLDFMSNDSRAMAQKFLCETYWSEDILTPEQIAPGSGVDPRLNMSVGLGGVSIHLGLLSNNGRRFWKYGSYTNEPNSGSCW